MRSLKFAKNSENFTLKVVRTHKMLDIPTLPRSHENYDRLSETYHSSAEDNLAKPQ